MEAEARRASDAIMPDPHLGKLFGGYELVRVLGRGGMGAVYEGLDSVTGRRAAIKIMRGELGDDSDALHRFEREARVASEIDHPNIARVIGSGAEDGLHYLVMEFIDGCSLRDVIRENGRIAYPLTLDYVRQACMGLQAAYEQGCIHRDIKPENLMLTHEGVVKIVDFGLAKRESSDSFKTATGAVMGTPHYMAPEQAAGRNVDHRSDIYSLGGTFYHLLTGQTPFKADSAIAIIQMHLCNEVQSVNVWNPEVPDAICQVVYRMMRKNPDDRYQTHGHLIRVLEDLIEGRSAPSMTMEVVNEFSAENLMAEEKKDLRRFILAGAAVFILLLAAFGVHHANQVKAEEAAEVAKAEEEERKGMTKSDWRTETMPMLIDISKHLREQDDAERNFESRRERTNR